MFPILPRLCLAASIALAAAHCRLERVDTGSETPGDSVDLRPLPPTLVAVGLTGADAREALRHLCRRRHLGLGAEQLGAALARVECRRRSRGAASAGAVVMDGRGRWGAAIAVPPEYLASAAATRAMRAQAGATTGAAMQQPLADCPVALSFEDPTTRRSMPPLEGPKPETPVAASPTAVAQLLDASIGHSGEDAGQAPDLAGRASIEHGEAKDATVGRASVGPGVRRRSSLLMRDAGGGFHVALLLAPGDPQVGAPLVPVGFDLVPGQLAFAGPAGAVVAHAPSSRSILKDPAPAAARYRALLDASTGESDPRTDAEADAYPYTALLSDGTDPAAVGPAATGHAPSRWELTDATCDNLGGPR